MKMRAQAVGIAPSVVQMFRDHADLIREARSRYAQKRHYLFYWVVQINPEGELPERFRDFETPSESGQTLLFVFLPLSRVAICNTRCLSHNGRRAFESMQRSDVS